MKSADIHTIGEAFQKHAQLHAHKTALFYLGTAYTYEKIRQWTLSFAHSLADAGIQPGDRVILYLPNTPQWAISWLGILTLGASAVPMTPIYTPHDLKYIANDSGAKAIVCTDVNYGYVEQVLSETGIETVIHIGAQPNIVRATFKRLADNVEAQTRELKVEALNSCSA